MKTAQRDLLNEEEKNKIKLNFAELISLNNTWHGTARTNHNPSKCPDIAMM